MSPRATRASPRITTCTRELVGEVRVDVVRIDVRMEPQQNRPGERCPDQEGELWAGESGQVMGLLVEPG